MVGQLRGVRSEKDDELAVSGGGRHGRPRFYLPVSYLMTLSAARWLANAGRVAQQAQGVRHEAYPELVAHVRWRRER